MPDDPPTPGKAQLSAYFADMGKKGGKRRKELHPAVPSEQFDCSCKDPDGTHTPFRTTCRRGYNEWQRRRRERRSKEE